MRRVLLASAFSLLTLPALAGGQSTIGGPIGPGTNANQQTGVNSAISTGEIGSTSTATGGAGGAGGAGGSGGNAGGGSARSRVVNNNTITNGGGGGGSGPSDITVRSAPAAIAPNLYGANPCTVGVSGAGGWIASSIGLGALWESENCANRDWYRLHAGAGRQDAAKGTACLVASQREMFRQIGDPCPQDRQPPVVQPVVAQPQTVMTPNTAADPTASPTKCRNVRDARPRTTFHRDYLRANCGG